MVRKIEKEAYLTVDDSPSKEMEEKLNFLLSKSIPVIWFCVGKKMEKRPKPIIKAIKKGHIIGNHSYSHPYFSDLTLEECYNEIRKTDKIINKLYQKAGVERERKYFRFPYGDKGGLNYEEVFEPYEGKGKIRKEKLQEFLRKLGYEKPKLDITYDYYKEADLLEDVDWYWTYDVMLWALQEENPPHGIETMEDVYKRMEADVPKGCRGLNYPRSDDIILIHDHRGNLENFKKVIKRLLEKGIELKIPSKS